MLDGLVDNGDAEPILCLQRTSSNVLPVSNSSASSAQFSQVNWDSGLQSADEQIRQEAAYRV